MDVDTDGLESIRNSAERRRAALARARAGYDRRAMREYVAHEVFAEEGHSVGDVGPAGVAALTPERVGSVATAAPTATATALPLPEPRRRFAGGLLGRRVTQRWTEVG